MTENTAIGIFRKINLDSPPKRGDFQYENKYRRKLTTSDY